MKRVGQVRGCARRGGLYRAVICVATLCPVSVAVAQEKPAEETVPSAEAARDEESEQASDEAASPTDDDEEMQARLAKLEAALAAQSKKLEEQNQVLGALRERAQAAEASAAAAEETATMAMTTGGAEEQVEERRIDLYGFADMAFTKLYIPDNTRFSGIIDRDSTFAMGNVNLYVDANPNPAFRFLAEVRFSLYPHGDPNSNFQLGDTRTFDRASATGRNRVIRSSTIIERAWIEWKKYDVFKVRAGYFLTPYGIWNVDHGSPTLISSVLPTFWASEYFPTRQVGVQALGEVFNDHWEYGYRAYVTNGRVDQSQFEVDPFKLFGGRIYARYTGDFQAQVGLSGYFNQEAVTEKEITSFDPFLVEGTRTEQFEEFGIGSDVSIDVGDLRTRTEFVLHQREYVDGLRGQIEGSPVYRIDETRWNIYNILAYRLPWAGLEPFTFIEYGNRPTSSDNSSWIFSGGVIDHLAPGTQLKFQAFYTHFPNDDVFEDASDADFPGWDLRLVTAF